MIITRSQSAGKLVLLSYIIGVYLGDGSAYVIKKKLGGTDYCVSLGSIDKDFVETFRDCLFFVFGKWSNVYTRCRDKRFPNGQQMYEVKIYSKKLVNYLQRYTKFKSILPRVIYNSIATKLACIAGTIDSEGHFSESKNKKYTLKDGSSKLSPAIQYMSGLCCCQLWIHKIIEIARDLGAICYLDKDRGCNPHPKVHYKSPLITYRFNIYSMIKSNITFTISRKHNRMIKAAQSYKLPISENVVLSILRDLKRSPLYAEKVKSELGRDIKRVVETATPRV